MSELDKYKTENKVKNPLEDYWTSYVNRTYGAPNLTGVDYNALTDAQKSQYDADKKIADRYALLQGNYESGVQSTEKNRAIDLQNNYINSQLAQKYMPIYLKKAGIDNLGIAQSTISELGTNYANLVGQTNREHDAELSALKDAYNTSMYELMGEHQTATDTVKAQNEANALALLQNAFKDVEASNSKGVSSSAYEELKKAYEENIGQLTNPVDKKNYEDLYNSLYQTNSFSAYDMTNPTAMLDDIYKKWNNGEYSNVTGLENTLSELRSVLTEQLNNGAIEKEKTYNKYINKINEIEKEMQNGMSVTGKYIPGVGLEEQSSKKQWDTIASTELNKFTDKELLLAQKITEQRIKDLTPDNETEERSMNNNKGFLHMAKQRLKEINDEIKRRGL